MSETVPFGFFDGLLVIEEWTPLEPDVVDQNAPGGGLVLEVMVRWRTEPISYEPAG